MNRRGFLAAMIAGAALDPEELLWKPGAKLISIPKPAPLAYSLAFSLLRKGDIVMINGRQCVVTEPHGPQFVHCENENGEVIGIQQFAIAELVNPGPFDEGPQFLPTRYGLVCDPYEPPAGRRAHYHSQSLVLPVRRFTT